MSSPGRDTMRIEWDVPIEMADGNVLRADVFRPEGEGPVPVILSHGPYGKWLHFEDGSPFPWSRLSEEHPTALARTSNRYQSWEVADPEAWVPDGFACVRVDSRGAGRSPGRLDPLSPQEVRDLYTCIEWAGMQPWSNGRVGLSGISYYSMNQWQVAAQRPPHLAAMCAWEGASDLYRDMYYHGGVRSTFAQIWYEGRIQPRQHGLGARGHRSRFTGDWVSGPETLPPEVLEAERVDLWTETGEHPMNDDYWRARVPELERIEVPLLSAGNWGGMGLHLRGNVEGFARSGSRQKWLELHGRQHWTEYY
ncbi:MAG: CocE/NonD family hydrolase, partial [Candidatus Limnocylindria bacterium]